MERFHRLVGTLIESEQRVHPCEEQYDFPGVQTNQFGDPRWRKGVYDRTTAPIVDLTPVYASGSPSLNAVCRIDVYRVESRLGVIPRFTLGGCALWELYDHIQLMFGGAHIAIQELDSCNSIDKESSRSAAQ